MPRILVADDNTNIQRMVSLAFQERGVEVTSVGNGEAAVRRVPDLNPDLILADIFMPVRNGYEVCEWIKKDPKYAHIPVILLVGAFDPLDEKEARRVGADGILKKPFIPPDPLIAMVTATLEKNPKLAAELAKAKGAVEEAVESPVAAAPVHVAPPPPPSPNLAARIPAPIEIAPVTDDSADDASLAYGFGAGHRDIDTDGHDEPAAARAPKSDLEKAEEEFDGASTTSDWRRSAMSFEVSEEDARRPAFSDEDLEPAPVEAAAENIVEPIVESMPAIEPLPGTIIDPTLEAEPEPLTEADLKAPESWQILPDDSASATEGDIHSEWASDVPDVPTEPYPVAASAPSITNNEEPAAVVLDTVAESVPEGVAEPEHVERAHELVATISTSEPAPSESVSPAPSFAAKASHWMDAMGSASTQPPSDWLSIVQSQQNRPSQNADVVNEAPLASVAEALESKSVEEAPAAPANALAPESAEIDTAMHAAQSAEKDTEEDASQPVSSASPVAGHVELHDDESVSQEDEDWFFAEDEPQSAIQTEPVSNAAASSSSEPAHQPAVPQDNPFEATISEPVAVSPSREETDFVEEEAAAPIAAHDSQLIEPSAVHVTPEPLLVDEYSSQESDRRYGHIDQEVAPAYTFLPPVETNVDSASSLSEQDRQEESVLPSFGEPQGAADATQSSASASDEDTVPSYVPPPPTREQLAHIPFLNPPPDIQQEAEKNPNSEVAQFAVDAVVERILQKIEPQLHDLLSQNLKPLIESLVHTEIQKHDH